MVLDALLRAVDAVDLPREEAGFAAADVRGFLAATGDFFAAVFFAGLVMILAP